MRPYPVVGVGHVCVVVVIVVGAARLGWALAGKALASELAIAALAMNTDLFFTVSSLR